MIVKKIPAQAGTKTGGSRRARHVADLVDYMNQPDKESMFRAYLIDYFTKEKLPQFTGERLCQVGARNFVSTEFTGQRAEMMGVAQAAVLSPNPLDHWLLSWRTGEFPTQSQVDESVDIFMDELKLARHQCIYAVHGDTHNRHVHIALNRYDPSTERMVSADHGFAHESAHRAVARIVDRFGWEPEKNARYVMSNGSPVLSRAAASRRSEGRRSLSRAAAAFETRTGLRSAQRIAQEDALPVMREARSWSDLHERLAAAGFTYNEVGTNGATIAIGGEYVKSSQVHRDATITALERRLGAPFEPRSANVIVLERATSSEPLPDAFRADEYQQEVVSWKGRRDIQRAEHARLKAEEDQERRVHRAALAKHDWAGRLDEKHLIAAALAQLRRQKFQRSASIKRPPGTLEEWLHEEHEIWFAERWRNRLRPASQALELAGAKLDCAKLPPDIDGYRGYPMRDGTRYAREGEGTAFIDRGDRILIVPDQSDEALLAAIRLAIIKFDKQFNVRGSAEFKKRVFDLAERHHLDNAITNSQFVARREAKMRATLPPLDERSSERPFTTGVPGHQEKPAERSGRSGLVDQATGMSPLPSPGTSYAVRAAPKGPARSDQPRLPENGRGTDRDS